MIFRPSTLFVCCTEKEMASPLLAFVGEGNVNEMENFNQKFPLKSFHLNGYTSQCYSQNQKVHVYSSCASS